jgi:hypothetical protein
MKRLDQALLLATNANVSVDVTLNYSFAKDNNSPVNNSTWETQNTIWHTLNDAHGLMPSLTIYFDSVVFANSTSKVDVLIRQKRFATDNATVAPLIGAGSLVSGEGRILTIPLHFSKFAAAQATHGFFVTITPTTTTLTTASLYLTDDPTINS